MVYNIVFDVTTFPVKCSSRDISLRVCKWHLFISNLTEDVFQVLKDTFTSNYARPLRFQTVPFSEGFFFSTENQNIDKLLTLDLKSAPPMLWNNPISAKTQTHYTYIRMYRYIFRRSCHTCTCVRVREQWAGGGCTKGRCMYAWLQLGPGRELPKEKVNCTEWNAASHACLIKYIDIKLRGFPTKSSAEWGSVF